MNIMDPGDGRSEALVGTGTHHCPRGRDGHLELAPRDTLARLAFSLSEMVSKVLEWRTPVYSTELEVSFHIVSRALPISLNFSHCYELIFPPEIPAILDRH